MIAADLPLASAPRAGSGLQVGPESPWLGLRSFTEEWREYFFGRDCEIQELYERVLHRPLTVLFGQSGLGKTSLLCAGLIPRLREAGYRPVPIRLVHDVEAEPLERQVVTEICQTFRTTAWRPRREPLPDTGLWQLFHDPDFGFVGSPEAQSLQPVLIVDQLEEIFTLGEAKRPADARALWESLACLVENRPPLAIRRTLEHDDELADRLLLSLQPCKLLLAVRDDFLHRLERWRCQMPSMMDNRLELRLLAGPQAFRAVYEAGARRAATADPAAQSPPPKPPIVPPDTARAIVRFVAGAAADVPLEEIDNVPPLLSLICEQLNARRLAQGEETIHAEALEQSAPEVLHDFYTGCFLPHPPAVRDFVERELVSESGFREHVTLDTAIADLRRAGVPDPEAVVRALVDQRLLVMEDRGGVSRVEFTHDILAPIAAASRAERAARVAREEAERSLAEQHRKARLRANMVGLMGLLTLFALVGGIVAWRKATETEAATRQAIQQREEAERQREEARKQAQRAESEAKRARDANTRNLDLLHHASLVHTASGRRAWQDDFDATRKGEYAASVGGMSKWHEAVAYFARALELEPGNQRAAHWLYSALVQDAREKCHPPGRDLRHIDWVWDASFSPDGTAVITAGREGCARIWEVTTGRPRGKPLQHEDGVLAANFSPDGSKVVTASIDGTARLWEVNTGKPLGPPLRHQDSVRMARFNPDGSKVVTASMDQTAQVWDASTGKPVGTPLRHGAHVRDARFSPDGSQVVTASGDKTAQVWDLATGRPCGAPLRHEDWVWDASFSPDASKIVTASADQTARIWETATGRLLGEPLRHHGVVWTACFSPDGSKLVTASGDFTARVWEAATGKPLGGPLRHEGWVWNASFDPTGSKVATASKDNTARVWDVDTGQPLGEPLRHEDYVRNASFSPDGSKVVTASDDRTARVWDVAAGRSLGKFLGHEKVIVSTNVSPDGSTAVTCSADQTARFWDVATGQPRGEPLRHGSEVCGAVFSPDGSKVVTVGRDQTAQVWDVASGGLVGQPFRHESVFLWWPSFSPDGSKVVTASDDRTARVWETATGKPLGEPLRHDDRVQRARFSADGAQLVTLCNSKTTRVWDAARGKLLEESVAQATSYGSSSPRPDALPAVAAGADKIAQVWEVTADPLDAIGQVSPGVWGWACALAGLRFDEHNELQLIPPTERRAALASAELPPGPWAELARWLNAPAPARTFHPDSRRAPRQLPDRKRDGS
jgi:WD40 repeat protein